MKSGGTDSSQLEQPGKRKAPVLPPGDQLGQHSQVIEPRRVMTYTHGQPLGSLVLSSSLSSSSLRRSASTLAQSMPILQMISQENPR